MLEGYKTYLVSFVGLVWAVTGLTMGWIDMAQASLAIQVSLTAMGIRSAMK